MRAIIFRWALVALGVLAVWIGGVLWLNSSVYSAERFAEDYLGAIASGEFGQAAALSGVSDEIRALPDSSVSITEVQATGSQAVSPTDVLVQVDYLMDGEPARTVFTLQRLPRVLGVFDSWAFAIPPTAELSGSGVGIRQVTVNGYRLPASTPHTVLIPGQYTVAAGNQWSAAGEVSEILTSAEQQWALELELQPTATLRDEVTSALAEFLQECASRQVLQPASCPFGTQVSDRLTGLPTWTITVLPTLDFDLSADGSYWMVEATAGVATVTGTIQSLFDGSLRPLNRDVPFGLSAEVTNLTSDSPALRIN